MNLHNAETLGVALIVLLFLSTFALIILGIIAHFKRKPPLNEEFKEIRQIIETKHGEQKQSVSRCYKHTDDKVDDLRRELREDIKKQGDESKDMLQRLSVIESENKMQSQTLNEHGSKLDLILQRLPHS